MDDHDFDGYADVSCGGDDCNDWDGAIFPGSGGEVCEAGMPNRAVDEDCTPTTFGTLDADGDGHIYDECCNREPTGTLHCGDDCNDGDPARHGGATEICNRLDDDCDRVIDEDIAATQTYYADCDGDGVGRGDWLGVALCLNPGMPPAAPTLCPAGSAAGWALSRDDCNDANPGIGHAACVPGAMIECDAGDDPCASLPAAARNPINHHVRRCLRETCQFGDECLPETIISYRDGTALTASAATTACTATNSCGCSDSDGVCVAAGTDAVVRTSIGLVPGFYSIVFSGTIPGTTTVDLHVTLGDTIISTTSQVSGSFSVSAQMRVLDAFGMCPELVFGLNRGSADVPVSVDRFSLLRTE